LIPESPVCVALAGHGESWRWCSGCSQGITTSSPKLSRRHRYLYRGPHEDASCSSITGLVMIIAPFLHFNTFPFGLHFHQFKDDQCLCALLIRMSEVVNQDILAKTTHLCLPHADGLLSVVMTTHSWKENTIVGTADILGFLQCFGPNTLQY